jgi:hypothetical protein
MGVLSSYVDFQYLRETYPNHIICDANTSMIYGSPGCSLPVTEEITLRKKLQFIKNPSIYNIEDVSDILIDNDNDLNIEDISQKRTFSENAQYIFFNIIKNVLVKAQPQCLEDGVFDSQKFLEEITNEELRDCWEKIINTVGFEYFILSYQYLDDSNTKVFCNLCKYEAMEEKIINRQGLYHWKLNLPNTVNLFNELELKAKSLENMKNKKLDKYIENLSSYASHYSQVLSGEIQKNSINLNISNIKKKQILSQHNRLKRNTFSYDFAVANKMFLDNSNNDIQQNYYYSNKKSVINSQNVVIESTNENFNMKKYTFKVYGKKGFIKFLSEIFEILSSKDISQIGYHLDILTEINKQMNEKIKQTKELNTFLKIIEQESEYEYEDNSEAGNSLLYTYDKKSLLELPRIDCFQHYLVQAYYLAEYSDSRDIIFDLYKRAVELDSDSFPCIRFYQYIDEFNETSKLRFFVNNCNSELIGKILTFKMKKVSKMKAVHVDENALKKQQSRTLEDSKQSFLNELDNQVAEITLSETMKRKSSKKLGNMANNLKDNVDSRTSNFKNIDTRKSYIVESIETIVSSFLI